MSVELAHPWALLLLIAVPFWWWRVRRARDAGIVFSRAATVKRLGTRGAAFLGILPEILRTAALVSLILAIAGPRTGARVVEETSQGIDIMIALDVSSSMLAEDFAPNRLGAAKNTVARFIDARTHDRIGLVAFAAEALTQVPATGDHAILAQALGNVEVGMLEDGTAIGLGLATAANRLKQAGGQSRVIILMSDGENNRGSVDPRSAAKAAAAFGIRVFTIGVGSRTRARIPVAITANGMLRYAWMPVSIDEPLLADIARTTGGRYYRATDQRALERVYGEIDRLVKTNVKVRRYVRFSERYLPFLLAAAVLLVAEWCFRATRWGRVP
ncbi:MAG TPA: VWA domain-containing protein [Longimicrobium sp.]|nr:VWA domain-containing protein [Longimicrobium sp.]